MHSTKQTKQNTPVLSFNKWKKKCWKSLSTEFFAVLPLSVRCICPTVKSITGPQPPQPNTSTPCELSNVASAYLAFVPLHNSVSVGASVCASLWSILHHRMLRNPGSGLHLPPHFLRTNPTFRLLESLRPHPKGLFKSPDRGAWNHVSWLFPGLQWLEWFSGRPRVSASVAGFDHRPHQENEFYYSACVL